MQPDIHALVGEIYACVDDPLHWQAVLPRIASALGGHAAALQHQSKTDAGIGMSYTTGLDPAWMKRYLRDWDAVNPWRSRGLDYGWSRPEDARFTAIHASRLTAPSEFRKTAVFNESLRDADLFDCVCMPLFADDHAMWVAVFCGQRKDCFDTDDIEIARYLAAHIGRAASLSAGLAAKRVESLPGASGPIIVVEDAKFVGANAAAYSALIGSGAARAENGRVEFNGDAVTRRFAEFLASDGARKTRGALCALDLGEGRYLSVYRPPAIEKSASSRAEYLLLFDRESTGVGHAERCAEALSISKSDAELALLFAEGLSPDDVARLCGGAPSDYRARMSAVYARLGVKDQGALVLRVLAATRSVGLLQAD